MTTRDHDGDERKHQTEQRATKPTIRHTRLRATGSHTQQPLKARLTPPCSSLPEVCVKDGTIRPPLPQRRSCTGFRRVTELLLVVHRRKLSRLGLPGHTHSSSSAERSPGRTQTQ